MEYLERTKKPKKKIVYISDYVMSDEGGLGHLISISKMAELNLLFFNKFVHIFVVFIDR